MYHVLMELSQTEIGTLRNLSDRARGGTDFVGISAAMRLTGYGLAAKTRQGWAITGAGLVWLTEQSASDGGNRGAAVIPFQRHAAAEVAQ